MRASLIALSMASWTALSIGECATEVVGAPGVADGRTGAHAARAR